MLCKFILKGSIPGCVFCSQVSRHTFLFNWLRLLGAREVRAVGKQAWPRKGPGAGLTPSGAEPMAAARGLE